MSGVGKSEMGKLYSEENKFPTAFFLAKLSARTVLLHLTSGSKRVESQKRSVGSRAVRGNFNKNRVYMHRATLR